MDEKQIINPESKEINYGKRTIKTVTVYPLSVKDQEDLTSLIIQAVMDIAKAAGADSTKGAKKKKLSEEEQNRHFVENALKVITENLPVVFQKVADLESKEEAKEILDQFTNNQLSEVITYVWEVNYEVILKNVTSLVEKVTKTFLSAGQSPQLSKDTLNIVSKTSTEKVGETEG